MKKALVVIALAIGLFRATPAQASLTTFQTFVGTYGVSTDGWGSIDPVTGTISASVPVGATVVAAYLYTATWGTVNPAVGGNLNGTPVAYGASVPNTAVCCSLASNRADVTSIVAAAVNGGPGGVYNFSITETNSATQDGEALVVVYSLPSLPVSTVGILDGFAAANGDTATINFTQALDPTAPGFFADMYLGIGFSCCSPNTSNQRSEVEVNGTLMTANAGDNDDGVGADGNGNLITVGSFDDLIAPNPTPSAAAYLADNEAYSLTSFINTGDTSITILTNNPSNDDNIFLAVFRVLGEAGINEPPPGPTDPSAVPEPGTLSLLALGGAAIIGKLRRRKKV
jgi:hypothetical protein